MLCLYILCVRARNNNINEQKKTNRRGNWARLMPGISFDVVDVKHNYAKKIIICYYYRKIRIFFSYFARNQKFMAERASCADWRAEHKCPTSLWEIRRVCRSAIEVVFKMNCYL